MTLEQKELPSGWTFLENEADYKAWDYRIGGEGCQEPPSYPCFAQAFFVIDGAEYFYVTKKAVYEMESALGLGVKSEGTE